jgi:Ion channel
VIEVDFSTGVNLLVRAAACFDLAGQHRSAAQTYSHAATELERNGVQFTAAGELYNRAALHFRDAGEHFTAGTNWRHAAAAFSKSSDSVLTGLDNISPLPSAAGKFTMVAICYTAGADAFLLAGDEAKWACGAYWEAGRAHSAQGTPYHAFISYRKALTSVARFYGTHEMLYTRLPLTEQEKASRVNPLILMEQEILGTQTHRKGNPMVVIETNRLVTEAYHEFYVTFAAIGNGGEAALYRAKEKERTRQIMLARGRYERAALYWIWRLTSNYGESLRRWAATCVVVLLSFSVLYKVFKLAEPVSHWFDYFYFSVVTFTSLGYGDIHPVGIAGKAVACFEIVSGLVMFGLLHTFVRNRFQR